MRETHVTKESSTQKERKGGSDHSYSDSKVNPAESEKIYIKIKEGWL